MLSAAIRVLARSAAIQLEQVAALSAVHPATPTSGAASAASGPSFSSAVASAKGKERADAIDQIQAHDHQYQFPQDVLSLFPQTQSLSDTLERHELSKRSAGTSAPPPTISTGTSSKSASALSPLDRLIQQAPHAPPPPAPDTHPDRKYEAERAVREREKASRQSVERTPKSKSTSPASTATTTSQTNYSKQTLSLDELIQSAPHAPPPPAPATHPDRRLEKELNLKAKLDGVPQAVASPTGTLGDVASSTSADLSELPSTTTTLTPDAAANTTVTSPHLESLAAQHIDAVDSIGDHGADPTTIRTQIEEEADTPVVLRASKVPSSRIGRLFHYGSLAASLSFGAASESIRRTTGGGKAGSGSVFMSDANIRRLVATLGRMRGAALKLGQFMSIQDNHMLPPEIERVLHQVQAHANYMPDWQMEKVMREEFGSDWQSLFSSFDRTPIASASIGQVHRATLASDGTPVAVKIQFPGVASSIESDLSNLSLLLRSSALLPKGLYLQNTIAVMRRELQDECDYVKEAAAGRKFAEYLEKDGYFTVPKVVESATTSKVLTTEWMDGKPLSKVKGLSQEARDRIGKNILRLCLMELFQFRFMQTDPNWANFLYASSPESIQLIDFGASREYTKEFMDGWYRLLTSCLEGDREKMKVESLNLGYLTGEENEVMLEAHLDSMALVASPFSHPGPYPFAKQTITDSIRALIPVMLKHRLTPPPQETYSLNRKLSGAFLMCAKLGANVDCQKLWEEVVGDYREG